MANAYIVTALRSPGGKANRGTLCHKRPDDLCADLIQAVLKANPTLDPNLIDDVIVGCAMPEAEQGMNVARFALLLAGLPDHVPGMTVNRFCSSGLQTIAMAKALIESGDADCILAGGTESMTLIPMMGHKVVGSRAVMEEHPDFYLSMGLTAENVAEEYKVTREVQDQFALESHTKAIAAINTGLFKDEVVPVPVHLRTPGSEGQVETQTISFDTDEGPRPDTTTKVLSKLKPVFKRGGTVTAGNSSQMTDGAAMALVCSESFLEKANLTPMARLVAHAAVGVAPRVMGIGPIVAVPKALKKAGLAVKDIERFELNEAFAAQSIACVKELKLNPEIVNLTGGAIALGHPLGATGAKLTATLLHGMKRDKQKYGIVTMCIGTGMGAAGIFELC